jgi:hypothetical protein
MTMEVIGFEVTNEVFEAKAKEMVGALDEVVSDPYRSILQVVLTWDEYATMLPELRKRSVAVNAYTPVVFSFYGDNHLAPPDENLHYGGCYKGVDIYYQSHPRKADKVKP